MDPLAPDRDLTGTKIGKYTVADEVGFGGMSVVYRARDDVLGREVALKVLHPHLAKREDARRRFEREARAVAKLRHPNIVEIYDFSASESSAAFLVTEFIHGPTLREFIEENGVAFPEIGAMIAIEVGEALAHAHAHGVIHRDIKPENVMIRPDGVVKLMDFGIAQVRDTAKMTETGSLLGSPAHMAPEVVAGEEPDVRADVFSLGTVLYYLATGHLPFDGRNAASLLRAISEGRYMDPEMRDPRVGHRLGALIRKALETDPDDRHDTVAELVVELRQGLEAVGVSNVRKSLRRFFQEPEAFTREFKPRLVTALEELGREALEQRQVGRAVDCFNRVLAIDDDHEGVRKLLARLDRRRRVTGYMIGVVALVTLAFVGLFVSGAFTTEPSDEPLVGPAVDDTLELIEAAADEAGDSARVAALTAAAQDSGDQLASAVGVTTTAYVVANGVVERARSNLTIAAALALIEQDAQVEPRGDDPPVVGRVEPVADPEGDGGANGDGEDVVFVAEVLVRFQLRPTAVSVWVDGVEYQVNQYHTGIRLAPGSHEVEYRHPLGLTEEQRTVVEVPETDIFRVPRVTLPWKPAQLLVRTDIPARIIVDGADVGLSGEAIPIPIDSETGERTVHVEAVPSGVRGRLFEREVNVSANNQSSIQARLSN